MCIRDSVYAEMGGKRDSAVNGRYDARGELGGKSLIGVEKAGGTLG